jgi:hypothetical protein
VIKMINLNVLNVYKLIFLWIKAINVSAFKAFIGINLLNYVKVNSKKKKKIFQLFY